MSTVELPEPVAQCLAAAAAKRGMTVDELAAETIAARFGDQNTSDTDALTAFIGSVDTGDPEWASTDTAVLARPLTTAAALTALLLVDTNIWLAAADRSSRQHQACAQLLIEHAHELASTVPVIAENCVAATGPQRARIPTPVPDHHRNRAHRRHRSHPGRLERITDLVDTYADLALDIIDASTIAAAEQTQPDHHRHPGPPRFPHRASCPHHRIRTHSHTNLTSPRFLRQPRSAAEGAPGQRTQ